MAALHPALCPLCGPPERWPCGLVFHKRWIHYKESCPGPDGAHWDMLATIVERTWTPAPAAVAAPPMRKVKEYQRQVLEIG